MNTSFSNAPYTPAPPGGDVLSTAQGPSSMTAASQIAAQVSQQALENAQKQAAQANQTSFHQLVTLAALTAPVWGTLLLFRKRLFR